MTLESEYLHGKREDAELTVADLDALRGNAVLYSEKAWAVLRKQSHGIDWVTDHGSHATPVITSAEALAWTNDWEILRKGERPHE